MNFLSRVIFNDVFWSYYVGILQFLNYKII